MRQEGRNFRRKLIIIEDLVYYQTRGNYQRIFHAAANETEVYTPLRVIQDGEGLSG